MMSPLKQCGRLVALATSKPCGPTSRTLSTSASVLDSGDSKGFFGSFFERKVETQQSSLKTKFASAKEEIIELQTHNVKPDSIEKYLQAHKNLVDYINANKNDLHCEALGNFRVFVGDEDQVRAVLTVDR
jgi:hypothetical protein